MSIHAVRERAEGFSNVKSIAYIALELVDKVHIDLQLAWVGEVDT